MTAPMFPYMALVAGATLVANSSAAQCAHQVMHTQGTQVLGAIEVTVTSTGMVGSLSSYCSGTIAPYLVGHDGTGPLSATGAYTFTFDPPIDSAIIHVGGLSGDGPDPLEALRTFVDGAHYAVPVVGQAHACEDLAMLTPDGDITGCTFCFVSGWDGTVIHGPISTLTVQDTVWYDGSGGALFSLFICGAASNGIAAVEEGYSIALHPVPATDHVVVELSGPAMQAWLVDVTGSVGPGFALRTGVNTIPLTGVASGVHALRLSSGEVRRFIKQ